MINAQVQISALREDLCEMFILCEQNFEMIFSRKPQNTGSPSHDSAQK